MKVILLYMLTLILLASSFNGLGQTGVRANKSPMETVYKNAVRQFSAFEENHGHFIQTPNVNMHFLTWGNPKHPCFIWAHGSMNTAYEMLHIADRIAEAGFYVIAIEYYGHGQTGIPAHEVSIYNVADDIKYLMDDLSIKKAFIGGFSRGGYIASAFYDAYPESVSGLVLEDGGSVAANTYYHKLDEAALRKEAEKFDQTAVHSFDTTFQTRYDAFRKLYDPDEKADQFPVLGLIRKRAANDWSVVYAGMPSLFSMENSKQFLDLTLRPTRVSLFASSMMTMQPKIIFRSLNVPVLILDPVCEHDPMPFELENQALQSSHPDFIDYLVYKDTEHNIHYAHPEKFTADVIAFLKKSQK